MVFLSADSRFEAGALCLAHFGLFLGIYYTYNIIPILPVLSQFIGYLGTPMRNLLVYKTFFEN
jgi:hypothetical protein